MAARSSTPPPGPSTAVAAVRIIAIIRQLSHTLLLLLLLLQLYLVPGAVVVLLVFYSVKIVVRGGSVFTRNAIETRLWYILELQSRVGAKLTLITTNLSPKREECGSKRDFNEEKK